MKKFEFRLHRVLDLRRQQAEVEQAALVVLNNTLNGYESQRVSLAGQLVDARVLVKQSPMPGGDDFAALARFERHVESRSQFLTAQKLKIAKEIALQRSKVVEAQRKVKLLENLRQRRLAEWTAESDRELELLGADSHLSRMLADRRRAAI